MPKLFFVLLGCKPEGRHTEQHDVFFGIGETLADLLPQFEAFWPEASGKLHIDSWREVSQVDQFAIRILPRKEQAAPKNNRLFFLNLGGYKPGDLEEYHYKMLMVAENKTEAIQQAKASAFYQHTGFEGAHSHIDDKYGVDVDDIYEIEDILPEDLKAQYRIAIEKTDKLTADELHIGYLKLSLLRN